MIINFKTIFLKKDFVKIIKYFHLFLINKLFENTKFSKIKNNYIILTSEVGYTSKQLELQHRLLLRCSLLMGLSPYLWIYSGICWEYLKIFLWNSWKNLENSSQELVPKNFSPEIPKNFPQIWSTFSQRNSLEFVKRNSSDRVMRNSSERVMRNSLEWITWNTPEWVTRNSLEWDTKNS